MSIAIKVEDLSKAYQLGEIGTGTISRDLERWVAKVRGKEDPFLRIGQTNDRAVKGTSDVVWSLKDINFEIEQGDAVGIIGRNGAGKSTLLKILSRVTSPTTGKITGRGRIASLLEVGTGFHPELTGRENIFLNGAILGMRKKEIVRKFEEIVDFAGVERYIDTPVKRYSSGMYVRLAFAVAAHLESEILIVDEVLAVGDAEFQQKCLGKMGEVSKGEGRTVLFVSHNMAAVSTLCTKGILLSQGKLNFKGNVPDTLDRYIIGNTNIAGEKSWDSEFAPGDEIVKIKNIKIMVDDEIVDQVPINEDVHCICEYEVLMDDVKINASMHLLDNLSKCIFATSNMHSSSLNKDPWFGKEFKRGVYQSTCTIPKNFLNEGKYLISWFILTNVSNINAMAEEAVAVNVFETGEMRKEFNGHWIGLIRPKMEWSTKLIMK